VRQLLTLLLQLLQQQPGFGAVVSGVCHLDLLWLAVGLLLLLMWLLRLGEPGCAGEAASLHVLVALC
jgi:hypothetical protein